MSAVLQSGRHEINVEYWRGIHLTDSILWMDAPRQVDLSFISHAHLDRPLLHAKVLATEATVRLAADRLAGCKTLVSPWNRRFSLGDLDLELYPAGHMLGSAQLKVTTGGRTLVYTGHFCLEPLRTAESARVLECDALVLDSSYGLPWMRFPSRQQVEQDILRWVTRTLDERATPLLFAHPLGTAQELASLCSAHGLKTRVHRSIYAHCKTYQAFGVELPGVRRFRAAPARDEVAIFPLHLARSTAVEKIPKVRLAMVSGHAIEPRAVQGWKVDVVFALSTQADHSALTRYARESKAAKVYVVGRYSEFLASELRAGGVRAWPLRPPTQLDLFSMTARRSAS